METFKWGGVLKHLFVVWLRAMYMRQDFKSTFHSVIVALGKETNFYFFLMKHSLSTYWNRFYW